MMTCRECEEVNEPGVAYCVNPSCGAILLPVKASEPDPEPVGEPGPPARPRGRWVVGTVVALVIVLAAITVWVTRQPAPAADPPRANAAPTWEPERVTPSAETSPTPEPSTVTTTATTEPEPDTKPPGTTTKPPATTGPPPPQTLTMNVRHDTTLVIGTPDQVYGTAVEMGTCGQPCAQSSTAAFERLALMKFETGSVPSGRCVTAMSLRVHAKNAVGSYKLYRTALDWGEDRATWAHRPARWEHAGSGGGRSGSGWVTFTLNTRAGLLNAYSYELLGTDTAASAFGTREDGHAPQLSITHQPC